MSKKIPFDVKFKPQIESGEYKVEIGCDNPWPARIVCWDFDGNNLIVAVRNPNDREEGLIYSIDGKHKAVCPKIDSDLFLITPEPEMSEFEKALSKCLCDAVVRPEEEDYDKWAKEYAPELLELAKDEIYSHECLVEYAETSKAEGKAEALKDLPRWRVSRAMRSTLPTIMYGDNGSILYKDGFEISISDLEKLPKEEQK